MISVTTLFGRDARILRDTEFQLLLLANLYGPLGVALISPLLDSLTGPFGVSGEAIGLMVSVFTAPGIVMIPLAGVLADRYGRKVVLIAGLVLFGGAGGAIALTTDFRVVLALRLVQGVGFAGLVPIIITALGDLYSGAEEATAQGLRFMTSGLSQAVFPFLAGSLVVVAWQYPFLLYVTAFPVAALVYLRLEEPAEAATSAATDGGEVDDGSLRDLFALARHRRVGAILVARGLPIVPWYGFLTFNSIIVVRILGGTPQVAGLLVGVSSLTYAIAASQAGRVTAVFDSRLYPLIAANVFLGGGLALLAGAPAVPVAVVGAAVLGSGFGTTMSLYRSIITGYAPAALRGGLVSIGESLGRIVGTLTPIAMAAAIGLAEPAVGFVPAVQWTGLGFGLLGALGGIVCLVVATTAPPAPTGEATPRR